MTREDPLEKRMATHSSIIPWEIPWTEEPAGYGPWGSLRVEHDLATKQQQSSQRPDDVHSLFIISPLQMRTLRLKDHL